LTVGLFHLIVDPLGSLVWALISGLVDIVSMPDGRAGRRANRWRSGSGR
jgi:hypothetical protein